MMKMLPKRGRATSLLPPDPCRDQIIESMRLDVEIEGVPCTTYVCQGYPICDVLLPSCAYQQTCPFCRCDRYDPKTGWTVNDPLKYRIQ